MQLQLSCSGAERNNPWRLPGRNLAATCHCHQHCTVSTYFPQLELSVMGLLHDPALPAAPVQQQGFNQNLACSHCLRVLQELQDLLLHLAEQEPPRHCMPATHLTPQVPTGPQCSLSLVVSCIQRERAHTQGWTVPTACQCAGGNTLVVPLTVLCRRPPISSHQHITTTPRTVHLPSQSVLPGLQTMLLVDTGVRPTASAVRAKWPATTSRASRRSFMSYSSRRRRWWVGRQLQSQQVGVVLGLEVLLGILACCPRSRSLSHIERCKIILSAAQTTSGLCMSTHACG